MSKASSLVDVERRAKRQKRKRKKQFCGSQQSPRYNQHIAKWASSPWRPVKAPAAALAAGPWPWPPRPAAAPHPPRPRRRSRSGPRGSGRTRLRATARGEGAAARLMVLVKISATRICWTSPQKQGDFLRMEIGKPRKAAPETHWARIYTKWLYIYIYVCIYVYVYIYIYIYTYTRTCILQDLPTENNSPNTTDVTRSHPRNFGHHLKSKKVRSKTWR